MEAPWSSLEDSLELFWLWWGCCFVETSIFRSSGEGQRNKKKVESVLFCRKSGLRGKTYWTLFSQCLSKMSIFNCKEKVLLFDHWLLLYLPYHEFERSPVWCTWAKIPLDSLGFYVHIKSVVLTGLFKVFTRVLQLFPFHWCLIMLSLRTWWSSFTHLLHEIFLTSASTWHFALGETEFFHPPLHLGHNFFAARGGEHIRLYLLRWGIHMW